MNASLEDAYTVDPKWAKKEHRRVLLVKAVTAGVMLSLAMAVAGLVLGAVNSNQITKIQKTPCNAHPAGKECAGLRQRVAQAEPIRNPCTSYQRVTGSRGRNCGQFYVDPHRHGASESPGGGDAQQPSSTAHQPHGPRGGGPANGVGGSGHHGGAHPAPTSTPNPPSETSSPARAQPSIIPPAMTTPSAPPPPVEAVEHPVVEGLGHVVEDVPEVVTGSANEALEGVHETTGCVLTKAC
jgi:hypothetical protein